MSNITQTPLTNPDSMIGEFCVSAGDVTNLFSSCIEHIDLISIIFGT